MNFRKLTQLAPCLCLVAQFGLATGNATASEFIAQARSAASPQKSVMRLPVRLPKTLRPSSGNRGVGECGNSILDPGELCDDGNAIPGDGCDASCQTEAGADCTLPIPPMNSANAVRDGSFELLDESWQGVATYNLIDNLPSDGQRNIRFLFDPVGNLAGFIEQELIIPGDATVLSFDYVGASSAPPSCGNARVWISLTDDSSVPVTLWNSDDALPGAGCAGATYLPISVPVDTFADGTTTRTLRVEHEYLVSGTASNFLLDNFEIASPIDPPTAPVPSSCLVGFCGDGILSSGEQCDDGNAVDGDGCSAPVGDRGPGAGCTVQERDYVCAAGDTAQMVLAGALERTEYVDDGGLEEGMDGPWSQTGTYFLPLCSEALCGFNNGRSGAFYAWFGGEDFDPFVVEPHVQTLSQTLTVGGDTLSFYVGTQCSSDTDTLSVSLDGDPAIFTLPCSQSTVLGPKQYTVDVSAYNDGGKHLLTFTGINNCDTFATDEICQSNFFLDDISIQTSGVREPEAGACTELAPLCTSGTGTALLFEQFESGIPAGWTTFHAGTVSDYTWSTTTDTDYSGSPASGCGGVEANWPGGNIVGTSGAAACADSDGAAAALLDDIDMDGVPEACETFDPTAGCQVRTYLCTPLIDPLSVTGGRLSFAVNYQTGQQDSTDGAAMPEEIFDVLAGGGPGLAPAAIPLFIDTFESGRQVFDHLSTTRDISGTRFISLDLNVFIDPAIAQTPRTEPFYVCFHYAGVYSWYAQLDNVAFRALDCDEPDDDFDLVPNSQDDCPGVIDVSAVDADGDGVADTADNCLCVDNSDQFDSNGDNIGNICDADVIGTECGVNFADLSAMKAAFFSNPASPTWNPDADLDNSGGVNFGDLNIMKSQFFGPPGPSASGCN